MPTTMEQVRAILDPDEPDYAQAARLGPDALPHLEVLVKDTDAMISSKAAYAASLIRDSRAIAVMKEAIQSNFPEVRIAAAGGARNIDSSVAADLLLALLEDPDMDVRATALQSVPIDASPALRAKVQSLITTDSDVTIRTLSKEVLNRFRPRPE